MGTKEEKETKTNTKRQIKKNKKDKLHGDKGHTYKRQNRKIKEKQKTKTKTEVKAHLSYRLLVKTAAQ